MKFAAILARHKGRDFYDSIFLLSKTKPNLDFLQARAGIASLTDLKAAVIERLNEIDLQKKKRDFMHLLFNVENAERILQFHEIIGTL